ncbi:hypothetical protein [Paraburkholderia azotifigens]|uniref:hypothetical protein n=1 Tax=Paraburkholderia azotifigens TaxID=2057004 RepID=UPI003CCC6FEB
MTQLRRGLDLPAKLKRKRHFLDEIQRIVRWSKLISLSEPNYSVGNTGRPPFPIATMLQKHIMWQLYGRLPVFHEPASMPSNMIRM